METLKIRLRRLAFMDEDEAKISQNEERQLVKAAKNGNVRAFRRIIAAHATTLDVHANRLAPQLHSESAVDELYAEGIMSVAKCIKRFNLDAGNRFITYLNTAVRRSMSKYVRDTWNYQRRHPQIVEGIEPEVFHTNSARLLNQYDQTLITLLSTILTPSETFALKVHCSAENKGTYADMQSIAAENGNHQSVDFWRRTYKSALEKAKGIKKMLDSLDR